MKFALTLVKTAVTVGLFWIILRNVQLHDLLAILRKSSWILIVLGTLQLALQPLLNALRWWVVILRLGAPLSFATAVKLTYIGTFFNSALPATVGGDALRVVLANRSGCALMPAVSSVVLERVAMLLALVLAVVCASPKFDGYAGLSTLRFLAPGLLLCMIVAIALVAMANRLPAFIRNWPIMQPVIQLAHDTAGVFFDPRTVGLIIGLALLSYLNMAITIYLFGWALGQSSSLLDYLPLVPLVLLVSTLPISIGGWGTREYAMMVVLGLIGVPSEIAVSISIMLGVAAIIVTLPGVPAYLGSRTVARSTALR